MSKIGPEGALGSYEIRPIHSAPSLGQSIPFYDFYGDLPDKDYQNAIFKD